MVASDPSTETLSVTTAAVTFEVVCEEHDEHLELCMTGDAAALGGWALDKAVPLSRADGATTWAVTVELPVGSTASYTFFMRSKLTRVLVRHETTQATMRSVSVAPDAVRLTVAVDHIVFENTYPAGAFLTSEFEIHLAFGIRKAYPLVLLDAVPSAATILGSLLTGPAERATLPLQTHFSASGADNVWVAGQPLTLKTRVSEANFAGSTMTLTVTLPDGTAFVAGITAAQLRQTAGVLELPLITTGTFTVGGSLVLSYLVARPSHDLANPLAARHSFYPWAYGHQFKIGHRGCGTSQRKAPGMIRSTLRENTLHSFIEAARRGVDMIEFDVMLTKDRVPIVYHNWKTIVYAEHAASRVTEPLPIHIKDLTLAQLRDLATEYSSEPKARFANYVRRNMPHILRLAQTADAQDGAAHLTPTKPHSQARVGWFEHIRQLERRIPTLAEAFERVPAHVGFNVEIKYPIAKVGKSDRDDYEDRNAYVDAILRVIMEKRGYRHIVISCFDPDVCLLVKLKQPTIPVMFLTTGGHSAHGAYSDVRCMSIPGAIHFCRAAGLLGICCLSTVLLENPQYISDIKTNNLLLFTWGEDNNNKANVKQQRMLGIDGIIADVHEPPELPPVSAEQPVQQQPEQQPVQPVQPVQ